MGLRLRTVFLANLVVCAALPSCHRSKEASIDPVEQPVSSTGNDALIAAYERIEIGMTAGEVDAILAAFPSDVKVVAEPYRSRDGKICHSEKTYDSTPDAREGDYYIIVFFDSNNVCIHKCLNAYLK
jgi:hypothetical protein